MKQNFPMESNSKLHRINFLNAEIDSLYHQAAWKLGISDSAMRILYTVYDNADGCSLRTVYAQSGICKQTVNSALRKLEAEGILSLSQEGGRKCVRLSEKGEDYIDRTAGQVYRAECRAFASWLPEEIDAYLRLMEKHATTLAGEVTKLTLEESL